MSGLIENSSQLWKVSFLFVPFLVCALKTLNVDIRTHPTDSNPRKVSLPKPCLLLFIFSMSMVNIVHLSCVLDSDSQQAAVHSVKERYKLRERIWKISLGMKRPTFESVLASLLWFKITRYYMAKVTWGQSPPATPSTFLWVAINLHGSHFKESIRLL